jgi:hypothetical protein
MRYRGAFRVNVVAVVAACGFAAALSLPIAAAAAGPAAASTPAATAAWGHAESVPGLAALNTYGGGLTGVNSISCSAPGDCTAGGEYSTGSSETNGWIQQAFVVTESNGTWGKAQEVPGTGGLNQGDWATVTSVSCASPGNCAAGGYYAASTSFESGPATVAFVASQVNGTWKQAQAVPGSAALGAYGAVNAVSCYAAGDCAAGGSTDGGAFVATEASGTWKTAITVPGTDTLSPEYGDATVTALSCAPAGNCALGGDYTDNSDDNQAYVADETGGTWKTAKAVPGLISLNTGDAATVTAISCTAAGACTAGGQYTTDATSPVGGETVTEAYVANEAGGTWGSAVEVPGTGKLNVGDQAEVTSVSCASPGACVAGGYYAYSDDGGVAPISEGFLAIESGGAWASATPATGGDASQVLSVSCPAVGDCAAGGYIFTSSTAHYDVPFVSSETGGAWAKPQVLTLSPGGFPDFSGADDHVSAISCAAPGNCAAGGPYLDDSDGGNAFLANETASAPKTPTTTTLSLSVPKVSYGHEQSENLSVAVTATPAAAVSGQVTIKAGSKAVCTVTLPSKAGSCKLSARKFGAGSVKLTAAFAGNASFAASTSAVHTLTVAKASSTTRLSLSASKITYGHEQSERLTATVSPQFSGTPGGKVTVKSGSKTVCTITLSSGKGSCKLSAKKLKAGTYHLSASYPGGTDFAKSASATRKLTVRK